MDAKTKTTNAGSDAAKRERRDGHETAVLGRQVYERDIRHLVEADHVGEIIAIDVDSGSWALGERGIDAVARLRETRPESVNILCERVGYRALRSFGAGSLRRTE